MAGVYEEQTGMTNGTVPGNNIGPWVPLTRVQDPPVKVLLASSLPVGLRRRLCAQLGIPSHAMDGSQDGLG